MQLTLDDLTKTSLSQKYEYFIKHIDSKIESIFNNNIDKNSELDRYEEIYDVYSISNDQLLFEIYNTEICLLRGNVGYDFIFCLIKTIDPNYLSKYTISEFFYNGNKIVLTCFNKLIIFDQNDDPCVLIDNFEEIYKILREIFYRKEIYKYLQSLQKDKHSVYNVDIMPILYKFDKSNLYQTKTGKVSIFFT